jgi:hypothetical protein
MWSWGIISLVAVALVRGGCCRLIRGNGCRLGRLAWAVHAAVAGMGLSPFVAWYRAGGQG